MYPKRSVTTLELTKKHLDNTFHAFVRKICKKMRLFSSPYLSDRPSGCNIFRIPEFIFMHIGKFCDISLTSASCA